MLHNPPPPTPPPPQIYPFWDHGVIPALTLKGIAEDPYSTALPTLRTAKGQGFGPPLGSEASWASRSNPRPAPLITSKGPQHKSLSPQNPV